MPRGSVGEICCSGPPVMKAYENNPEETAKNFIGPNKEWFKTGDLGYLDDDNYLYITGRSKEVINRGGEIIAPSEVGHAFPRIPPMKQNLALPHCAVHHPTLRLTSPTLIVQVENALVSHPRIKALVAFSTPHDMLQETIGVCIVTTPGCARVGLKGLHEHSALELHPSKWPQLILYASDLPKTATGKAMRVRLDKRMDLPMISDETPEAERLFECEMVAPGAPVQAPIPTRPLSIELGEAEAWLRKQPQLTDAHVCMLEVDRRRSVVGFFVSADGTEPEVGEALRGRMVDELNEYLIPAVLVAVEALPRGADGQVDEAQLPDVHSRRGHAAPMTDLERQVQEVWCSLLGLSADEASTDADFFFSGGTSLLAVS